MIVKFLKAYWPYVVCVLAFLALFAHNTLLRHQLETAKAQLSEEKAASMVLAGQLTAQNTAVKALEDAAKANREVYLAGLAAANKRAVRLEIDAEDILSTPPPVDPNRHCDAANELLKAVTQ